MRWFFPAVLTLTGCAAFAQMYTIKTVAGGALPDGVVATSASLLSHRGVAVNPSGNLFVALRSRHAIVRLNSDGTLTVVAGNGTKGFSGDNGPATNAQLAGPTGIAFDSAGNLFVADTLNGRIRKITNGVITTVAGAGIGYGGDGGSALSALLNEPASVAFDSAGALIIADQKNHRIRRVAGGVITTIAGNGTAGFAGDGGSPTGARLSNPSGVAVDAAGGVYIADTDNHRVRLVSNGIIRTFAGNGTAAYAGDGGAATSASLNRPVDVTLDGSGNLYIADSANHVIRRVSDGFMGTIAGTGVSGFSGDGGPSTRATLNIPNGVVVKSDGTIYISDADNRRIRRISGTTITTIAGSGDDLLNGDGGPAINARLTNPRGLALDATGILYISDEFGFRIRKIVNDTISTFAGTGVAGYSGDGGPASAAKIDRSVGIAFDSSGNLYLAEWGHDRVRMIAPGGVITTIAGNGGFGFRGDGGPATLASLAAPMMAVRDGAGNIYIADRRNHRIRRVSLDRTITTIAGTGTAAFGGDGGLATAASLNQPQALALDLEGNLFIADTSNHRVRRISTAGVITTVAGNGTAQFSGDNGPATGASLNFPVAIALDSDNNLYIGDAANHRIRRVSGGTIRTIAGGGTIFGDNGLATSAQLASPTYLTVDGSGNVYFSDSENQRVRLLTPVPVTISNNSPLPSGAVGVPYSQTLGASGGLAPYTWRVETGSLPAGLTLSTGGVLSGTPTAAGASSFTVRATDSLEETVTKAFNLTVVSCTPTFNPSPVSVGPGTGPGSVSVVRNSACLQWTATSSQSWLTITAGSPATGNSTVQFSVTANPSSASRSANITVAGQSVTVTQSGAGCNANFSAVGASIGAAGGSSTVSYTLPSGCTNTPSSSASWLTGTISSPGTLTYTASANPTLLERAATITLAGDTFTVTQAPSCAAVVDPSPVLVSSAAGSASVAVTRNGTCGQWTAASNQSWLTVTAGSPATGSATLQIQVQSNPGSTPRSATLTIANQAVTVTQAGAPCLAVFASQAGAASASGGTAAVSFSLPAGCTGTPASSASWLTASAGANSLSYTAEPNPAGIGRTATITLAGAVFTVSQSAAICSYNLTPGSRAVTSSQNTGTISVATLAGCRWTAESDASWLRVQGSDSGTGSGSVNYVVDPNPGAASRNGTMTIGARTFTVVQNGTAQQMACTASATPAVLRRNGITERTGDVTLTCSGVPAAGVTTDVGLTLSNTVTSRVLDAAGTATEALAILNAAASPVVGTSAWQAGLAGPNALRWKNVRIVPNGQGQATLRLTNVRVNAHAESSAVTALVELRSALTIALTNPSVSVGNTADGVTVTRGSTAAGPGANQTTVPFVFREQIGDAFRTRSAESGYFLGTAPLTAGQADTGTRFRVRLTVPSNVKVYAPVLSAGSESARLVSADASGNGGADVPDNASGYVELARSGDVVTATWEVKSSTAALDTLTFPVVVEGATSAQIESISSNMTAGFAPVSTAVTAVMSAPVPRFADASTYTPPVDLRIVPTSVTLGGAVSPASAKSERRLSVASSVISTYDVFNDSSVPAATTVVRSSAPAGYTFVEGGTQAPGSSNVSYSTDRSEARVTYDNLNPSDSRSLRLQITGQRERGDYIEILTTVESRQRDLDLSDNRSSVGMITEECPANTLNPVSAQFGPDGGPGQFNIASACSDWTVRSSDDWVTIDTARAGTGAITTRYTVAPNLTPSTRTTTIVAAGQTFAITQFPGGDIPECVYNVVPSVLPFAAAGETRSIFVQTAPGCAWPPTVSAPFVTQAVVAGGGEASGSGTLNVTVGANPGAARSGSIDIAGKKVTLLQAAACQTTLSPSSVSAPATGLVTTVFVSAQCGWQASSTARWLRVLQFPGAINLTVDSNFSPRQRTATVYIGSQTLTVTQAASAETEGERLTKLLFFQLFGRGASVADVQSWAAPLLVNRAQTVHSLFTAPETAQRSRFINSLYRGLLKRSPEYGGWILQRNSMANADVAKGPNGEPADPAKVRDALIGNFVNSAEFKLLFGTPTNAEFVRIVYRQMLGREPSQAEVDWQVSFMTGPNAQVVMARNTLLTPEVIARFEGGAVALLVYHALLLREAHPAEIADVQASLASGTTLATVIADIVSTAEFQALYK